MQHLTIILRSMDPGLYIAASGMLAEQVRQSQLSNDLSNASTPGYKPDQAEQQSFGALLLSNTTTGQPIGTIKTGVAIDKVVTDTSPAALNQTGQPLDFGIAGTGYFARAHRPGGPLHPRRPVHSPTPPASSSTARATSSWARTASRSRVSAKGTVPGSALGVFNVPNVAKQGNNLFTGTSTGRAGGVVRQGELEASGVDPVQTMTDMIASLRAYQAGQSAIQSIDQTMQENAQSVGSLGG